MNLSIIVSFELFFGDEYWKKCKLLCLNIHLQWKDKKQRWFKNSLMSWAFKVAKQMWDCVAIYTQQLKGVKKLKVEFLCLVLSYIITDILILHILCKRERNTKKFFTASFFTTLNCCVLVANGISNSFGHFDCSLSFWAHFISKIVYSDLRFSVPSLWRCWSR